MIDYTLDEFENLFNPNHYNRVTRSFIVKIKAIGKILVYFKGKLKLTLVPPKEGIISREYANEDKKWMGN